MSKNNYQSMVMEGFRVRDFSRLYGTMGFSDRLLSNHFKLYEGYVKNSNRLMEEMHQMEASKLSDDPAFGELKRRFGWEFNGMKLHELYFDNFGPEKGVPPGPGFLTQMRESFADINEWKEDFLGTASTRGIGWVVLYKDIAEGRLFNAWIDEHNNGHLIGSLPILVLDVFEHAFITDYGIERKKYLTNFYEQIDWKVVEERLNHRSR